MPKRKWTKLHDDAAIDNERRQRSLRLGQRHEARATIIEAVDDLREGPRSAPPEQSDPGDKPTSEQQTGE